jgi:DNA-binding LytR/AlgR family response regulator
MTVRTIVVEDEPLAVERLAGYVRQLPFMNLLATFDDALEALVFLQTNEVDLIFLDVHLGGVSGIELLQTATVTSQVILTTAHREYALQAYDLEVVDYLLKPFTFQRFVQAVDRARGNLARRAAPGEISAARTFFFVKTEHRLEKVQLRDVLYIEGVRDYRRIHTVRKRIMTLQTFGELERTLAADVVCRVHKSYMVALDKIESVERDRITIGEKRIPISETYREKFYALIGQRSQ